MDPDKFEKVFRPLFDKDGLLSLPNDSGGERWLEWIEEEWTDLDDEVILLAYDTIEIGDETKN